MDEPDGRVAPSGQLSLREIYADFARLGRAREGRPETAHAGGVNRRAFLGQVALGAASLAAGGRAASKALAGTAGTAAEARPTSRVVVVHHPEALIRGYTANPPVLRQMLDRAVVELTGAADERTAWRTLARADDFVAIKHNTTNTPVLHSHAELHETVADRLVAYAGCDRAKVLAVDRVVPEPYAAFSAPFTLPSRSLRTRLRTLYTDHATALINITVLKAHFDTGVSCAIKNLLGCVNNPAAFHDWSPGKMPRSLPELVALPPIRDRLRLCVVDATRPQYAGGPGPEPDRRWDYRRLIVGTDPVAVTAVGVKVLETRREEALGKPWPMTAAREMLAWAQAGGVGHADASHIRVVAVDLG